MVDTDPVEQADKMTEQSRIRAVAGLKSLFVADALAMPVHWYYNPRDITQAFPGGITQFEDAPHYHPSSIMSLHSTSSGGRGGQGGSDREIVGDVILKGKRRFWGQPNQHYHQQMKAGENTLNAHCARVLVRSMISADGRYDQERFLDDYIHFMTSESPQHPDTYAESYHRAFFANLEAGRPKDKCGGVTHDTPSVGGLVTISPIVIGERLRGTSLDRVRELCGDHLLLTHPDKNLAAVCDSYVQLIDRLLFRKPGEQPTEALQLAAKETLGVDLAAMTRKARTDSDIVGGRYSTACYISDSWPSVLYLAYKYVDDLRQGLLANANLGGDNVHRGAVLGSILGLASGATVEQWFSALTDQQNITNEIEALIPTTGQ